MRRELKHLWASLVGLSPNMRLLLVGAALLGLGNGIVGTFFNVYLKQAGLGEAFLGRLNSLGTIGSLALAIPAGLLVARLGSRMSLVLSCALIAVMSALQAGLPVPALLIVLQIGISASNMLYGATFNPEMMRNTTPQERQTVFSLAFTVSTFAMVLASALGGLLPHAFALLGASPLAGLRLTLLTGSALVLASILAFRKLHDGQPVRAAAETEQPGQDEPPVDPSWKRLALRYALVNVIIGFGAGMSIPYLNLYFTDRFHASTVVVGSLFAMSNVVLSIGALLAPWLVRRIGQMRTIAGTVGASLVFLLVMAFTDSLPVAAVAFWMRAGLMMCSTPITDKFCLELVPPERRSVAHNAFQMAWTGAWAVSTAIGGWLIQTSGFRLPMILTACAYGLYVAVFVASFRSHPAMRRTPAAAPAAIPVQAE